MCVLIVNSVYSSAKTTWNTVVFKENDIFELKMEIKKGIQEKLLGGLFSSVNEARSKLADAQNISKYHWITADRAALFAGKKSDHALK